MSSCIATIFENGYCDLVTHNDNLTSKIKSEIRPSFPVFNRLLKEKGNVVFKVNTENDLHIVSESSLPINAFDVPHTTAKHIEVSTGIKTVIIQNDMPHKVIKQNEIQNHSHKLEPRIGTSTTDSLCSIKTQKASYKKQIVDSNTGTANRTTKKVIERKASQQIRRRQKYNKGETSQPRRAEETSIYSLKQLNTTPDRSAFRIGRYDDISVQIVLPLDSDEGSYDNDLVIYSVQKDGYNHVGNVQLSHPIQASDGQDGKIALPVNVKEDAHRTALQSENQNRYRLQNLARHQDYQLLSGRQDTFSNWPHPQNEQDVNKMAQTGLFYTGNQDLVRCFHCGIGLKDWASSDDPLQVHIRHSQNCEFLRATIPQSEIEAYRNIFPIVNGQTDTERNPNQNLRLNDILPRPHSPQPLNERIRNLTFQDYDARVDSFTDWPSDIVQTPQQLADAGFFYTGVEDIVRCYACDGGLRKWDSEDDPWIEHAHWFPHCIHVIRERGQEYIDLIQVAAADDHEEDAGDVSREINNSFVNNNTGQVSDDPVYSPAVQRDFRFSRAAVKMAKRDCNNKNKRLKAEDLLIEKQENGEVLPPDSPRTHLPVLKRKRDKLPNKDEPVPKLMASNLYKKDHDDTLSQTEINSIGKCMESIGMLVGPGGSLGTAFRVGRKYLMTNWHVISSVIDPLKTGDEQECRLKDVWINFNHSTTDRPGRKPYLTYPVVYKNVNLDIVVLEVREDFITDIPVPLFLYRFDIESSYVNEATIVGFGHPTQEEKRCDPKCKIKLRPRSVEEAKYYVRSRRNEYNAKLERHGNDYIDDDLGYKDATDTDRFICSCFLEKGGSGAAALTTKDPKAIQVVGILSSGTPDFLFSREMSTELQDFPKEFRFETVIKMSSIYNAMLRETATLANELFQASVSSNYTVNTHAQTF